MKSFVVLFIMFFSQSLSAQEVINLWTGQAPYSKPNSLKEVVIESWGVQCAKNVTNPTLTVYRAQGDNSGKAMMPALQISISILLVMLRISSAARAADSISVNSRTIGVACPSMLAQAVSAFSAVRPVPRTCAPRKARTRMVS